MRHSPNAKGKTMTEMLQEFCDSRGVAMRVDRQAGVIRGVKILGLQSRNGRTYLPEALAQAAPALRRRQGQRESSQGQSRPARATTRTASARFATWPCRPGEGLFADFHFNPKHALAEQLLWDAEHAPENVGFSHNVEARTARRGEQVVVEAITRVQSVDLVADPATTRGLFEAAAAGGRPPEVRAGDAALEALRRQRPDLVEASAGEQAAEIARLREEVERLTASRGGRSRSAARRGGCCGSSICPTPRPADP